MGERSQIDEGVEFERRVRHETDKAWLVRIGDADVWLPKSQCVATQTNSDATAFAAPSWLAKKNGLIDDAGDLTQIGRSVGARPFGAMTVDDFLDYGDSVYPRVHILDWRGDWSPRR